ncbi:MAG: ribosome biogenesis GTPase YlqF [Candidatus Velthaea sp.]
MAPTELPDQNQIIQWFPGHMAQSMRKMAERLALVDVILEVVDARLPSLSTNPHLDSLVGGKPRVVLLGREDLADPTLTGKWIAYEEQLGRRAIAVNGKQTGSVGHALPILAELTGNRKNLRAMVVGIPNTGKSTIINALARRTAAKAEDKAGVTRQLQWFRVSPVLEIMDTPGILVPKIATREAQWQLALCNAIPRERYDAEEVVASLVKWAQARGRDAFPTLEDFARQRGFLRRGGDVDYHNASRAYIKDFGLGKFGRITFEEPPEAAA